MSRSYCHLCDEMIAALHELQGRFLEGVEIDVVDVDHHPALESKWGDKVPVLLDGDEEICHYFLAPDQLALHLAQA